MEILNVLILSSSTGGGHNMRARSLKLWLEKSIPRSQVVVTQLQVLEENSNLYRFGVNIYNWIQKWCPALHHLYFNFLELFHVSASPQFLLGKKRYKSQLKKIQPNIIVSVHAHTNHAFQIIAREIIPGLRFVTYCGEMTGGYGFSRHWTDPGVDAFIGATPEICQAAVKRQMPRSKVFYGGFLLNPDFYLNSSVSRLKSANLAHNLGLKSGIFTLLLCTGANVATNHITILKELEQSKINVQVIALCGQNHALKSKIKKISKEFTYINVHTLGKQKDMHSLMLISNLIVARPGTGTTSESILSGCPIVFNIIGGIMPQECITVNFMHTKGIKTGVINRPTDLSLLIRNSLKSQLFLEKTRQVIRLLRPEIEPSRIVLFLKELTIHGSSNHLNNP